MKDLKCKSFDITKRIFKNAITYKFGSRRVTVIDREKSFGIQFKVLNADPSHCVDSQFFRDKLHVTSLILSNEATELLMFAIAEMYDMKVVEKSKLEEMCAELDFYKSQNSAMSADIDKMQDMIP